MRKNLLTTIAAAGVCAALPGVALSQTAQNLSCESHVTSTADNRTQTAVDRLWIKGIGKIRQERTVGTQSQISIINGSDAWIIRPAQKQGMHQKLNAQQVAALSKGKMPPMGRALAATLVKAGAKKTGQERVDGVVCDVYKKTENNNLRNTIWVIPGPNGMIRRQQMEGTIRGATGPGQPMGTHIVKSVTDYNWKVGQPIDDALFRPPAGIAIQEMPAGGARISPPQGALGGKR